MSTTITGLTPETQYESYVYPDCDPFKPSETITFTTTELTTITQTIALSAGVNWVSFYVETDLNALKAALVETLPGTTMKIRSKTQTTTYNGSRWRGTLNTLDVAQMYKVEVSADCEITLEGAPVDPSEHPVTIAPGLNWIGFPFQTGMTLSNAFAGFAVSGDKVKGKTGSSTYNGTRWRGTAGDLVPGKGYIYQNSTNETKTFVYPTSKK